MDSTGRPWLVFAALVSFAALASCAKRPPSEDAVWPQAPAHDSRPSAATVLEVSGLVNGGESAYFTMEQLRGLPKTEFSSADPWISGVTRYGGFELYPFLTALRLSEGARYAVLTAVNAYSVTIDLAAVRDHRYLVAYEENGALYETFPDDRNKGPLSIAVPHEELAGIDMGVLKLNYVWWLKTIRISG